MLRLESRTPALAFSWAASDFLCAMLLLAHFTDKGVSVYVSETGFTV